MITKYGIDAGEVLTRLHHSVEVFTADSGEDALKQLVTGLWIS